MTEIHYIRSVDKFHEYYTYFNKCASIYSIDVKIIGFDVEYGDNGMLPCIIQMCAQNICLVIHLPSLVAIPEKLLAIIKNNNWIKMGVGVNGDLRKLSERYSLGFCAGGIDLDSIAKCTRQFQSPNLETLYRKFINPNYKSVVRDSGSAWKSGNLSDLDLKYAAWDAIMSYQIGTHMLDSLIRVLTSGRYIKCSRPPQIHISDLKINKNDSNGDSDDDIDLATINNTNYIARLNEYCQKNRGVCQRIHYSDINIGTIYTPKYRVTCQYGDDLSTTGEGFTKKQAKKIAAMRMYKLLMKK